MEDPAADLRARLSRCAFQRGEIEANGKPPPPPGRRARCRLEQVKTTERYVSVMVDGKNELLGPFTIAEAAEAVKKPPEGGFSAA